MTRMSTADTTESRRPMTDERAWLGLSLLAVGACGCCSAAAAARAGAGRRVVLLPGGRRRADREDRSTASPSRLHEGQPDDQGHADLRRHLPGDDRQGADRAQVGHAAGDLGAAVDRHVHADRRGRDRAVRRLRQDGRGQGLDERLLQGLHAEQPDRRQDLGHSVPALDRGDVLEQGAVQGSRARPEQAAHHLGRVEGRGDAS